MLNSCVLTWLQIKPRKTVIASMLCVYGMTVAVLGSNYHWLLLPAFIIGFLFTTLEYKQLAFIFIFFLILGWSYAKIRTLSGFDDLTISKEIVFSALILEILPDKNDNSTKLIVKANQLLFPRQQELNSKVLITINKDKAIKTLVSGKEIKITGHPHLPRSSQFPWDFDYRNYLYRQGICYLVKANKIDCIGREIKSINTYDQLCKKLRNKIINTHNKALGPIEGNFFAALVIGNKTLSLPSKLTEQFQILGLSHILAASGFNLTIVTGCVWYLGRIFIRSALLVSIISLFSIVLFIGLAGASASVLRASIMCGLVLISKASNKSLYTPATLSMALLINLLIEPLAILDVGLQLSYAATAGIIFGAKSFSSLIEKILFFVPKFFSEMISVILLAQASTFPIQLYYFWNIGLLSVLANLAIATIVPPITMLAFISSTFAGISFAVIQSEQVAIFIDQIAHYPSALMLVIVNYLSGFIGSKITIGPPHLITIYIYYLAMLSLLIALQKQTFRLITLICFSIAFSFLFLRAPLPSFTFYCSRNSFICLDSERNVFYLGNIENKNSNRFLSYYGISSPIKQSASYKTEYLNKSRLIVHDNNNQKSFLVNRHKPWRIDCLEDRNIKIYRSR